MQRRIVSQALRAKSKAECLKGLLRWLRIMIRAAGWARQDFINRDVRLQLDANVAKLEVMFWESMLVSSVTLVLAGFSFVHSVRAAAAAKGAISATRMMTTLSQLANRGQISDMMLVQASRLFRDTWAASNVFVRHKQMMAFVGTVAALVQGIKAVDTADSPADKARHAAGTAAEVGFALTDYGNAVKMVNFGIDQMIKYSRLEAYDIGKVLKDMPRIQRIYEKHLYLIVRKTKKFLRLCYCKPY